MFSNQKDFSFSGFLTLFLLTVIFAATARAQTNKLPVNDINFVSSQRIGTMSVAEVNQQIRKLFGDSVSPTTQAFELYKLNYRSTDEKNRVVTLTGLVVLPSGGAPNGLVIFNHGTLHNPALSPSRFTGKSNNSEAELAALAFASGGYAVAMPDYLGLGDHKAPHPYPLGAENSRSAVDIIAPARTLASRQNTRVATKLFVSGYSEGGAVAMWTVRDLEKKSVAIYEVSAAALASGPYDLSQTTRSWLLNSPTDQQEFVIRLYLASYMVHYFHKSRNLKITDYFKPSMAFTIAQAFKGGISDENIIKRLAVAATLMRSKNSLVNVITPRFQKALQKLDTNDPVIREMQKSDAYDWSPRTKMLLISLQGDKVVDPANTEKAFQTMRRRGVRADTLRRYLIKDANLNHITAVAPSLAQARRFFDGNFSGDDQ
jgi:dienelactone hydrolase